MWDLNHKEGWVPKNWCFWIVMLEKTLESPLDCEEIKLLPKEGPLPELESGLLSNTWKWIVRGDTCADKAIYFIGKGRLGREQEGRGTQENCSAMWFTVSGFMVMGLVSGLSLANPSDSQSFLVVHALLRQTGCQWEGSGRWLDTWCHLLTFPELFQLVVAY